MTGEAAEGRMQDQRREQTATMLFAVTRWIRRSAIAALLGAAWCAGNAGLAMAAESVGGSGTTAAAPGPAGDAARGKALFTGASALQSGAVSCIACHDAGGVGALGGGNLASDLSDAGERYTRGEGLADLLKDMPFPAMNAIYGPRPLTAVEAADLAAFLGEQTSKKRDNHTETFFGLGVLGMLLLAGLSQIIWRKRFKGVRQQLTGGR